MEVMFGKDEMCIEKGLGSVFREREDREGGGSRTSVVGKIWKAPQRATCKRHEETIRNK